MSRPGACKDRLAEALETFGRVPIEKRTLTVPAAHPVFRREEDPFWSAGGLVHDGRGRILLVRHTREKGWGDAWVTPGGRLEEGETVVEAFRREVHEEVGLEVRGARLTRILQENLTDGRRTRHGFFAQFVARAASRAARPGPDVVEVQWFDRLPPGLAFRRDYEGDFGGLPRDG